MNKGILALITLVLAGCGGGGADDGGGDPGPGPDPGTPTRPEFAQPAYVGRTDKASIDPDSATDIASAFALAIATVRQYENDGRNLSIPGNEVVDTSEAGSGGGSVRLQGRGDSARFGWLSATFDQYSADGVVLDGRLVEHRLRDGRGFEYTAISYHGLRVTAAGASAVRLDGTITYAGPSPLRTNTHNLSVSVGGESMFLRDLVAVYDRPTGPFNTGDRVALTGDLLHSGLGLVEVRTDVPMALSTHDTDLTITGQAQLTGNGAVRFMPLNNHFVSIEYAETGETFTRALRREWSDLFAGLDGAPHALVADPGTHEMWTSVPIELDARFSHGGDDAIEHTWTLIFGAPGESAWLDHPQGAVVRFQPGGPGEHLFRLTSTDGTTSRESYVIHTAFEGFVAEPAPFREHRQFGPGREVAVGDEVVIDMRLFITRDGNPPSQPMTLDVDGPAASGVDTAVVADDGESASFIPDFAGVYRIGDLEVFVDTPRHFAPAVNLNVEDGSPTGQNKRDIAEIRVGDARALLYLAGSHSGLGKLFLTELDDDAGFQPTVVLGEYMMHRMLVVDLNGDGSEDIVGVDGWTVEVLDQQADGSFVARAPIAYGPGGIFGCGQADIVIGDVFERGDRVLAVPCGSGLYTFDVTAAGALAAGVFHATPWFPAALITADLDGDGRGTLVFPHGRDFPLAAGFMVLRGNPDGTFDAPVLHPVDIGVTIPPLVAGADLDGDGRDELVATTHGELIVVAHDATGVAVRTDVHALSPEYTPKSLLVDDLDGVPGQEVAFTAAYPSEEILRVFSFDTALTPSEVRVTVGEQISQSSSVTAPLRTWDFNEDGLRDLLLLRISDGLDVHIAVRAIEGS